MMTSFNRARGRNSRVRLPKRTSSLADTPPALRTNERRVRLVARDVRKTGRSLWAQGRAPIIESRSHFSYADRPLAPSALACTTKFHLTPLPLPIRFRIMLSIAAASPLVSAYLAARLRCHVTAAPRWPSSTPCKSRLSLFCAAAAPLFCASEYFLAAPPPGSGVVSLVEQRRRILFGCRE